jgi:hypothetical protein
MSDSTPVVELLLARAGLPVSADELVAFVAAYEQQLAAVESLYAVEATRYESPALAFNPTPSFVDWA